MPRAARAKRRPRKLTRAQRLARSPRVPAGAILAYRLAIRGIAKRFATSVRAALKGKLADFALEQTRTDAAADEALDGVTFDTGTIFRASAGVAEKAVRNSKSEFGRIGIKLEDEPSLAKVTSSWRKNSAERVEKILARERDTIVSLLQSSEHRTPEELDDRIEDRLAVTASKLERAAHDDVLTLNAHINRERQTAAGIDQFEWTTADDARVRDSHAELDGQRFPWDDPPIVDGEAALPGEPDNCRCIAFPVLPELEDDA